MDSLWADAMQFYSCEANRKKCIVGHDCFWSFGFISAMETASDKELSASVAVMVCSLSENSKERKENK